MSESSSASSDGRLAKRGSRPGRPRSTSRRGTRSTSVASAVDSATVRMLVKGLQPSTQEALVALIMPSERRPRNGKLPIAEMFTEMLDDSAGPGGDQADDMCNMATMECGFVPPELNLTASMQTNPALVRVHMVRYNVSVAGANLSLVRDVVDRPEPNEELDCTVLAAIGGRALRACEIWRAFVRGEAPLAVARRGLRRRAPEEPPRPSAPSPPPCSCPPCTPPRRPPSR